MSRSSGPRIAIQGPGLFVLVVLDPAAPENARKSGSQSSITSASKNAPCQLYGRVTGGTKIEHGTTGSGTAIIGESVAATGGDTTGATTPSGCHVELYRSKLGLNTIKQHFMSRSCIISNVKTTMFCGPKARFPAIDRSNQRAKVSRQWDGDRHDLTVTKQTKAGRSLLLQLSQVRELREFMPARAWSLSGKRAHHTIETPCLNPSQDRRPRSGWLLDVMILFNRTRAAVWDAVSVRQ